MTPAWIRVLFQPRRVAPLGHPPSGRPNRARLEVEGLEDRITPADYTVTDIGDAGAGMGNSGDLRYCINQANGNNGPHTITIQKDLVGDVELLTALPALNQNITIVGNSHLVERSSTANADFRIFTVNSGKTVEIDLLRIQKGQFRVDDGGGILNQGNLTLKNVTVRGCTADKGGGSTTRGGRSS
jgi:hypothetical protein